MLTARLIPSLLLRQGRLVKGRCYGDHKDAGAPATTARAHNSQGADELLVLDIDASREGRGPDLDTIAKVADECFMPLTIGGGIASVETARACMGAGADKIMVTTTALERPQLVTDLAHVFGDQAVVVGIDVTRVGDTLRLFDHRTRNVVDGLDPVAWARQCVERGAGEIRLMAVDREGSREGFDLDLAHTFRQTLHVPLIVEGGAGSLDDLVTALEAGADAIAVGTLLVFSDNNLVKIQRFLASRGQRMRT